MASLAREENLAKHTGVARLVICADHVDYREEACKRSNEFTQGIVKRGVVVVAYATDGNKPGLEFEETNLTGEEMSQRLWRVAQVFVSEWERWLDDQKKLAGVSSYSPVYVVLRI